MIRIFTACPRDRSRAARRRAGGAAAPTLRREDALVPSRASLLAKLGEEVVDQGEEDGARGGEAVALGAALARAAAELGGGARIGQETADRRAQRNRLTGRNAKSPAPDDL